MTKGKAILIDPFMKQVTHVPYEYGGSYTQITEYIATPEAPKPLFTCVGINDHGDSIFVDDEGLYRDTQAYFAWEGYHQPLQGKGLVLGIDYTTGDSVPPTLSLEEINALIHFPMEQPVVEPRFEVRSFDSAAEMLEAMGINK